MPTRSIHLTGRLDRFIEAEIGSGRYGDASEVVGEGLRLLELRKQEDRARLQWLRRAVKEGTGQIDRGEGVAYGSIEAFEQDVDRLAAEASAALSRKSRRG